MMNFIKTLQNKPEPIRKTIMWIGIAVIMIVIFGIWILTFSGRTTPVAENPELSNLKKEMPGVWQALKTQVNSLQNLWPK